MTRCGARVRTVAEFDGARISAAEELRSRRRSRRSFGELGARHGDVAPAAAVAPLAAGLRTRLAISLVAVALGAEMLAPGRTWKLAWQSALLALTPESPDSACNFLLDSPVARKRARVACTRERAVARAGASERERREARHLARLVPSDTRARHRFGARRAGHQSPSRTSSHRRVVVRLCRRCFLLTHWEDEGRARRSLGAVTLGRTRVAAA